MLCLIEILGGKRDGTTLQQKEAKTQPHKKPGALNSLNNRWLTRLNLMEDLNRKHLRSVTHCYQRNSIGVQSMHHIRVLRSLCDSTLGAQRAYHFL